MAHLEGRRVVVVGGSSGIGLATAHAACMAGASVTIASRSADRLKAAAHTIGHNVQTAVLDTTTDAAVEAFFAAGVWDHLVISAAHTRTGPTRAMPMDDAVAAMNSKFWGAYRCARAAKIQPDGSITFVAGGLAHRPSASAVLQGAINAALESLGRGLALELAPIRVNTISPGLIDTPLLARLGEAARRDRLAKAAASLPVGRTGTGEDIAQAILFLMTNGFATGATVLLDGGAAIA